MKLSISVAFGIFLFKVLDDIVVFKGTIGLVSLFTHVAH